MKKILLIVLICITAGFAFSEEAQSETKEQISTLENQKPETESIFEDESESSTEEKKFDYTITFFNGTNNYFTMRQSDDNFMSFYEVLSDGIYNSFNDKNRVWSYYGNFLLDMFLYMPITHEEGHRSVLTAKNIGSVSQPIFNSSGAAYVKGVSDATLEELRSSDFPSFIRLYTAGLESDYSLKQKESAICAFNLGKVVEYTDFANKTYEEPIFKMEVLMRTLSIVFYETYGFIDKFRVNNGKASLSATSNEEENELERDIVGFDTYGMIYNLFEPDSEYKRYITFEMLNEEEKQFALRMSARTLFNFLNPLLFNKPYFTISDVITISGNMGYSLAPFGDYLEQNVYFKYKDFNFTLYSREFENRSSWSFGCGLGIVEYKPFNWLTLSADANFWMQPENLDFNTSAMVTGGAVELQTKFIFPSKIKNWIKGVGLNFAVLIKSAGFLPEAESLESDVNVNFGIVIRY